MRFTRFAGFILCAVLVATFSACAPKKAPIKLNFNSGDKRDVKLMSNTVMSMSAMGMNMEMTQSEEIEFGLVITNVDSSGSADMDVAINSYVLVSSNPMAGMMPGVDTNKPMDELGKALRGKSFKIRMSPYGAVESVTGWDEIKAAAIGAVEQATATGPMAGMGKMLVENAVSEEAIRNVIEGLFAVYREVPTSVGDTWSQSIEGAPGAPVKMNTTYKLADRKDGRATIESTGTLEMGDLFGELAKSGMPMPKMSMNFDGEMKGNIVVDDATGWIIRDEADLNFKGEMTIDMKDMPMQLPDGGKIPMTVSGKRVVETFSA